MAEEEISAESEDLSTGGKWLESQTVVADVTSMPLKARRDVRDPYMDDQIRPSILHTPAKSWRACK